MKFLIHYILILTSILLIGACSSEKESQKEKEPESAQINLQNNMPEPADTSQYVDTANTYNYDSWKSVHFQNVKIVFPENHPFTDKMSDYAQIYKTLLRRSSQFFHLPEPTDSIVMFYYTGFGQGQEIANSEFPTARGDSIYYWPGNKFGMTAAEQTLERWTTKKTQFNFLYQGIMRLLDASGRDYHAMTLGFIDSTKFKTIQDLLDDEHVNVHAEAYQSAEAASFVDYFIFKFGIDNFKLLYESPLPFEKTIQTICYMNIDTLEKDWIAVISQATQKKN